MSGPLLIRGGRVVDPSQAIDVVRDVLVVDGVVAEVGEGISKAGEGVSVNGGGVSVNGGGVAMLGNGLAG